MHILIADDNEDAAESLSALLEAYGHETRRAGNGVEALECCSDGWPEVAILDLDMPVMNGIEAAQHIRANWPHVALVALTGRPGCLAGSKSFKYRFDMYLEKGAPLQVLYEGLRTLAHRTEAR